MGEKTQFDYLKGSLLQFNHQKEELTKKVKEYCQNKEFPLDKRWDLFINSNLGEHDSCYIDLKSYNMDDFLAYRDRHEYIEVDLIIEFISDNTVNPDDFIDSVKEELLQMFIKSFTYYW